MNQEFRVPMGPKFQHLRWVLKIYIKDIEYQHMTMKITINMCLIDSECKWIFINIESSIIHCNLYYFLHFTFSHLQIMVMFITIVPSYYLCCRVHSQHHRTACLLLHSTLVEQILLIVLLMVCHQVAIWIHENPTSNFASLYHVG